VRWFNKQKKKLQKCKKAGEKLIIALCSEVNERMTLEQLFWKEYGLDESVNVHDIRQWLFLDTDIPEQEFKN